MKSKKPQLPAYVPFKHLELQLKLEDIEAKWEEAKRSYDENSTAKDMDKVLKLTVEKIQILTEISYYDCAEA